MVTLHKFNGEEFILNASLIETIDARPDTVITLLNEKKYLVREKAEEITAKIIEYQRSVFMVDRT
jgi:flagellar protein FlbD